MILNRKTVIQNGRQFLEKGEDITEEFHETETPAK